MAGNIEFQLDNSKPLLPQVKALITAHRKAGSNINLVDLLPENYLTVLHEMKEARGFPKTDEQTVLIIKNIMDCKIEMAIKES